MVLFCLLIKSTTIPDSVLAPLCSQWGMGLQGHFVLIPKFSQFPLTVLFSQGFLGADEMLEYCVPDWVTSGVESDGSFLT